jgi:nitronate monooxygenase
VIAAGGIMDGRGIAAAFALGASGVQMGTAFLTCPEAAVPDVHRQALRAARAEDSRVTKLLTGRPARALRTPYLDQLAGHEADALDYPLQLGLIGPLRQVAQAAGNHDFTALWAGQAAPLVRDLPAGELVATLVREAEAAWQR